MAFKGPFQPKRFYGSFPSGFSETVAEKQSREEEVPVPDLSLEQ